MKVALKGYYGFGNLGDDMLLLVSYRTVRALFPQAKIYICTESPSPDYIRKWVDDAEILSYHSKLSVDWLILGGGGVFFDFKHGNLGNSIINCLIRIIGYSRFSRWYDTSISPDRVTAKRSVGIGVGVDNFTSDSPKFMHNIRLLSSLNVLLLRDSMSQKNTLKYKLKTQTKVSTDLVFLTEKWLNNAYSKEKKIHKKIGFILRDWQYDNHRHIHVMIKVMDELSSQGYEVECFSFDKVADPFFLSQVEDKYLTHIWEPSNSDLEKYLKNIQKMNLVVTSRAHGAIISACLGVQGICIAIEPKLKTVQKMLPKAYKVVSSDESHESIIGHIHSSWKQLGKLDNELSSDVEYNQTMIKESIGWLDNYIKEKNGA